MSKAPDFIPEAVIIQDRAASIASSWLKMGPPPRPAWNRKSLQATIATGYDPSESMYAAIVTRMLERQGVTYASGAILLQRAALAKFRDRGVEPAEVAGAFLTRFGNKFSAR